MAVGSYVAPAPWLNSLHHTHLGQQAVIKVALGSRHVHLLKRLAVVRLLKQGECTNL